MAYYLVTGGAGFIGSHIVTELVKRRHKVAVLDNFITGRQENLDLVRDKITVFEGSVTDPLVVNRAMKRVDYVLHQAALRAVQRSVEDPWDTNEVNIGGTLQVLLGAKEAGVKRVVLASSSSVYGSLKANLNNEKMPTHPESPYALSKLTGEYYARLFSDLYGLETVCLRYFNVFGPRQRPDSAYAAVIPLMTQALLTGEPVEVHWHGRQSRDFTYVANVVQANLKAATSLKVRSGEAYNIGMGQTTSINELLQNLKELLKVDPEVKRLPKRAGDILGTRADIRKAKRDLGYEPKIDFEHGLKKSLDWYRSNINA